jgi:hypothetical protein
MTEEGRLAVPAQLPVGEPVRGVIARLLEPAPARRFATARAAREALLQPGAALVPTAAGVGAGVALAASLDLGPAPRALTAGGPATERFRALAHSAWQLMDPDARPEDGWGLGDVASLAFFSLITAGVLPLVFIGIARARRRRLRTFFEQGQPAVAHVLEPFGEEQLGFGVKLARVRYEFEADGAVRRGSDLVLPRVADRWRAGDGIEVLYLAERGYDSVIVSTG